MDFRDRAQEVKAQGEARRGEFNPTGVPLRVYQWWANNGGDAPERENFCHFWRVVMIWAPLLWAFRVVADNLWVQIVAGCVALLAVVGLCIAFNSVAIALGAVLGVFVALMAVFLGASQLERWIKRKGWQRQATKALEIFFITALGVLILTVLIGLGTVHWWFPLVALGGVALLAGLITLMVFLGERLTEKSRAEAEAARLARNEYFWEHGEWPATPTKQPGRVSKFFHGLGDFLILIGNVVRVNKWKICPIVKIEN